MTSPAAAEKRYHLVARFLSHTTAFLFSLFVLRLASLMRVYELHSGAEEIRIIS